MNFPGYSLDHNPMEYDEIEKWETDGMDSTRSNKNFDLRKDPINPASTIGPEYTDWDVVTDATYVGRTYKKLKTRCKEHLSMHDSQFYQHINDSGICQKF